MKIREVNENKKQFIALLLLADEQENMIDHYLEKGTMYVLEDGNVKAECVVTDEDNGILEIKNIAVDPQNQGQGYGKALIDFLVSKYADEYSILQVGTGDSPLTVPFYEKCGFVRSHNIPNFFTDNYDHNIVIGSFIGVFIGFGIYKFWHFKTYPNLYAMQSAPWYTELLLDGALVAVLVVVCIILKLIIWRKLKP